MAVQLATPNHEHGFLVRGARYIIVILIVILGRLVLAPARAGTATVVTIGCGDAVCGRQYPATGQGGQHDQDAQPPESAPAVMGKARGQAPEPPHMFFFCAGWWWVRGCY
jgi:hypothetical protein